jgi:hypothetical protein
MHFMDSPTASDGHRPETATVRIGLFRSLSARAARRDGRHWRLARRLAFDALALLGFRLKEGFGGGPMTRLLAFGTSLVEPQEIGNLTDAIVAIRRCRPWLELAVCAAFHWRIGGLLAAAQ